MKVQGTSSAFSQDLIRSFREASAASKVLFVTAGSMILGLSGYLLWSMYPVLLELMDQALTTDYSASFMQVGK